jgi:cephalosporin-C deacetylase
LSYVDTMNLADRIRCPVLMSVGLQDEVCPPRTAFSTYNQVRSTKAYRVYPWSGHFVGDEHDAIRRQWMNDRLGLTD